VIEENEVKLDALVKELEESKEVSAKKTKLQELGKSMEACDVLI